MNIESISFKDPNFDYKLINSLTTIGFVQIIDLDFETPNISNQFFNFPDIFNSDSKNMKPPPNCKWFGSTLKAPKEILEWKNGIIDSDSNFHAILNYSKSIEQFAKKVLGILIKNLDLNISYDNFSSTFRLIKYDNDCKGVNLCDPHTDSGWITLLWQSSPGLIVEIDNKWIPVTVNHNALILNVGDALSQISNYMLKATNHAVLNNFNDVTRYSIPFFVEPLDSFELKDPDNGKYLEYKDWLINKFKRANFVEYLKN